METKLEQFRATLEAAQLKALIASKVDCEGNRNQCHARVKIGRKYANVDVGGGAVWSGKYMVELDTGAIYGIKGYGVIHRGHYYGTLDTISEWNWGGYRAFKRQAEAQAA